MDKLRYSVERGYAPGDKILFRMPDGQVVEDEIRCFSTHEVCLEPYGRNYTEDQVILRNHSWTTFDRIITKIF